MKSYLSYWNDEEISDILMMIRQNGNIEKYFSEKEGLAKKVKKNATSSNKLATLKRQLAHDSILNSRKYRREDIYSVYLTSNEDVETSEESLELQFLTQLFLLDYHCRSSKNAQKKFEQEVNTMRRECLNTEDFFSTSVEVKPKLADKDEAFSSGDLVLQSLMKCDDFLLQDAFQKMTACQLAVPIIVKFETKLVFHLWATRTVRKNWVLQNKKVLEGFITNKPMGCISFCRIGSTSISKSKLANTILSTAQGWPEHSYFLHRDIDAESVLTAGSIEATWYCPEGRQREHLKDIHCIYNLRGDARENPSQLKFLMTVSSLVIFLIEKTELSEDEMRMVMSMEGNLILIHLGKEGSNKFMDKKVWLNALNLNSKDLSELLIDNLPKQLDKKLSLEGHAECARKLQMEVDEDKNECVLGKEAAAKFAKRVKDYDITNLKAKVVPLQGEVLHQWAKKDKEETRHQFRGQTSPQEYSDKLRQQKLELRDYQYQSGPSAEIKKLKNFGVSRPTSSEILFAMVSNGTE